MDLGLSEQFSIVHWMSLLSFYGGFWKLLSSCLGSVSG